MGFCKKCGEEFRDDASFCGNCGTPTGIVTLNASDFKFQTIKKDGEDFEIKRCPSCGQGIPSFVAICPACGNEMSSAKISKTLNNFIYQINQSEKKIAKNQNYYSSGFMSWNLEKKLFWILLNIVFFCIPLSFYLILPLFSKRTTPSLSLEEKEMVSLIENYPVPNDRSSILETMVYTKEKIDFISKETVNRKSYFWIRLWSHKAEGLKEKADILFPEDKVVAETFREIYLDRKNVNKRILSKAFFGFILLIATLSFLAFFTREYERRARFGRFLVMPETELGKLLPKLEEVEGEVTLQSSKYLSIECRKFSMEAFEEYKKRCIESGFDIDPEVDGSSYTAYNKDGYKLRISNYENVLKIRLQGKLVMRKISIPATTLGNLLPRPKSDIGKVEYSTKEYLTIYIGNTSLKDYDDYVKQCMEAGFEEDISIYGKYFRASNKEGYKLRVRYEGFQIIEINVDAPEITK